MIPFSITITIKAPLDHVWRNLVDWKSQGDWMAMTRVESSDHGADDSGVGTTIDAFTGIGPIGIRDLMRVTRWEPPHFCAVDHYGRWIKGIGEFRLESVSGNSMSATPQTKFHWYEEIAGPRAVISLVKPAIMVAVYFSLRRFARRCE
jgi:hypothetical protein